MLGELKEVIIETTNLCIHITNDCKRNLRDFFIRNDNVKALIILTYNDRKIVFTKKPKKKTSAPE